MDFTQVALQGAVGNANHVTLEKSDDDDDRLVSYETDQDVTWDEL